MLFRLKLLILLAAASALGFCGWLLWFALSPIDLAAPSVDFSIRPGSTLRGATRQITDAGVLVSEWKFNALARANSASTEIKAGSYQVSVGVTPLLLIRKITRGDYAQAEIRFIEGSSDLAVLAHAYRTMQRQLQSAWAQRAQDLPVTDPYEALILASIVEKETGRASDRAMIAGVFANRLRLGVRLQTDPSVIYGMGEQFDGNLRKKDLVTDTPFNTYTRRGLPPHPIAMPGLASLAAVMHPAQTDALYFVSRGDGTSEFSRTLVEHNRAVARYQMPGSRRRALP